MEKHSRLIKIRDLGKKGYFPYVECRCECGNIIEVNKYKFESGHTRSCGCLKGKPIINLVGHKYGILTVISYEGKDKKYSNITLWKCLCECGNKIIARQSNLRNGHTKSCGCSRGFDYKYDERAKKRLMKKIKINHDTGCWEWQAATARHGYGATIYKGKLIPAHRLFYLLYKGKIENGLYVCHSCDNPCCVNPEHLWLGTQKDNMKDMVKKGRSHQKKSISP